MPLHLDEFQKPQFQGYIENLPPQREYVLRNVLPIEQTNDIQFAYNVINGEYAQTASITGWNASAPLRDNKQFQRAFSEVAKVQHGILLDEKTLLQYNRPRTEDEKNRAIESVYTHADDLSMGVDDIEEYLRAQAVYTGKVVYNDNENDIHIDIDFGVPEENNLSATTGWNNKGSEPLTDLQSAIAQFKSKNQRKNPVAIHMTSATFANLLVNEQIKLQIFGDNANTRLITKDDVNTVFNALGFPPIVINDDVVLTDDGEQVLLADNRVVLIGDDLGNTMVGPTVENNYVPGKFVEPQIFQNPPSQGIIVGEAVFPALRRPSSIVFLDV